MRASSFVMLVVVASCRWHGMEHPPLGGRGGGGSTGGGVTTSGSTAGPSLTLKKVASRQEPRTLVAADGTRCIVTDEKYQQTAVGSSVWCVWQAP